MFLPVGFIQGLAAPLAGLFSDRFSPKIPAFIGMVLMGWTLYEFSYLSFLSEKSQIMLPLYIRGIALGILFAPLTTLAISEISNRKMAQASGLFNVIRQIGGSFGVALFGTILTRKTIYHTDIYGQQMNTGSAIYKLTIMKLQHAAIDRVGGTLADGLARAKALLVMFINEQAFISAVDDVFLIAAVIIFVGAIPILFLRTRHMKEARLRAAAASAPPATEKGQKT
jgi:DHA2 family multidrug resistance protein